MHVANQLYTRCFGRRDDILGNICSQYFPSRIFLGASGGRIVRVRKIQNARNGGNLARRCLNLLLEDLQVTDLSHLLYGLSDYRYIVQCVDQHKFGTTLFL